MVGLRNFDKVMGLGIHGLTIEIFLDLLQLSGHRVLLRLQICCWYWCLMDNTTKTLARK